MITFSWDVTQYSLVEMYQRFEGTLKTVLRKSGYQDANWVKLAARLCDDSNKYRLTYFEKNCHGAC
jgi:hypothetical protein